MLCIMMCIHYVIFYNTNPFCKPEVYTILMNQKCHTDCVSTEFISIDYEYCVG